MIEEKDNGLILFLLIIALLFGFFIGNSNMSVEKAYKYIMENRDDYIKYVFNIYEKHKKEAACCCGGNCTTSKCNGHSEPYYCKIARNSTPDEYKIDYLTSNYINYFYKGDSDYEYLKSIWYEQPFMD